MEELTLKDALEMEKVRHESAVASKEEEEIHLKKRQEILTACMDRCQKIIRKTENITEQRTYELEGLIEKCDKMLMETHKRPRESSSSVADEKEALRRKLDSLGCKICASDLLFYGIMSPVPTKAHEREIHRQSFIKRVSGGLFPEKIARFLVAEYDSRSVSIDVLRQMRAVLVKKLNETK
jgi:hypothetical protein